MTTKDEAEQKEAPISDLEITGTLIQARDAMAPMRGLILFDQAIERINKLLAQQKEAQQEPVAWMCQHNETGRITFVDQFQIDNGWAAGNTNYSVIKPCYASPPNHATVLRQALSALDKERALYVIHHDDGAPEYVIDAIAAIREVLK